jgi:hypothetical protein
MNVENRTPERMSGWPIVMDALIHASFMSSVRFGLKTGRPVLPDFIRSSERWSVLANRTCEISKWRRMGWRSEPGSSSSCASQCSTVSS